MPKPKKYSMGKYDPTEYEQEAYEWGVNNNIRISPCAKGANGQWFVSIYNKGKWNNTPETYGPGEVWEVVFNYYVYYYERK